MKVLVGVVFYAMMVCFTLVGNIRQCEKIKPTINDAPQYYYKTQMEYKIYEECQVESFAVSVIWPLYWMYRGFDKVIP